MHPTTAAFVATARDLGIEVVPRTFPEGTRTAEDAAAAIGVDVGQIVKSLAFRAVHEDGSTAVVMALVSGSNRLDEKALAAVAGADHTERADADEVRAATGYAIGGVPPIAHANPGTVLMDEDLFRFATVFPAGGTPHAMFEIAAEQLLRLSGAQVGVVRA